jgi:hypothetical protein
LYDDHRTLLRYVNHRTRFETPEAGMNDAQQRTNERDAAGALRAQRGADAVVAQYLHELSRRHGTRARAVEPVTGGDAEDGAVMTAKGR